MEDDLQREDKKQGFKYFEWRWHPMEDDVKILNVEYLRNHLLDPTQILNLEYLSNHWWVLRGKLEEISEEISSVALLSPACYYLII